MIQWRHGCLLTLRLYQRRHGLNLSHDRRPNGSTVSWIQALDLDPFAARADDQEPHHLVALFDHLDRRMRRARTMRVRSRGLSRRGACGANNRRTGRRHRTERRNGKNFFSLEERIHEVGRGGGVTGDSARGLLVSLDFPDTARLNVMRWLDSEFGGSPSRGFVSA